MITSLVAFGASGSALTFADDDDDHVTDLGTDHGLTEADAIAEYDDRGSTQADITRLDMTVTVADSKSEVGIEDKLFPMDVTNDYVRLEYNEQAERTVRILIPDDYWEPYERSEVDSITSDHVAEYDPVRGGDYTALTIHFDGEADVVLPAEWVSSFSYRAVDRIDNRLNNSLGFTVRDDNSQWVYVDSAAMTEGPGYDMGESPGDVTVQYDATPDSPEETWINAPEGETLSDNIYYYERDSANGSAYIVSKTDDPPNVRYNVDSSLTDRVRGDINELRNIPNAIKDLFGGGFGG